MSGAPSAASTSVNSLSTCPRSLASQANALAPVSFTNDSRSPVLRAASATLIPSLASADDQRGLEFGVRHGGVTRFTRVGCDPARLTCGADHGDGRQLAGGARQARGYCRYCWMRVVRNPARPCWSMEYCQDRNSSTVRV